MVSGNMPAFRAYSSSTQNIAVTIATKMVVNTKTPTFNWFDTNNNYDAVTNYRFTPTISGYYQVNSNGYAQTVTLGNGIQFFIFKNGSQYGIGSTGSANTNNYAYSTVSTLVYLNGSTDYIECYATTFGTGTIACACTEFSGILVRAT